MWALTTSNGMRVDGIQREQDGRDAVRMLVVDNQGRRFIAELRKVRAA